MDQNDNKDKKISCEDQTGQQKMPHNYKAFKSKIEGLEDISFESRAVKCVALFTNALEEITNYMQIKYNNAAKMIGDVMRQTFNYPRRLEEDVTFLNV